MLRFFFKKRMIRRQRKRLMLQYLKYKFLVNLYPNNPILHYNCNFFITLPKRQHHFVFFDLKKKKEFGFSCGSFLIKMGRKTKSFKRNHKNIMSINLHFKKLYGAFLKYIYLFLINNFNYRQYLFFKKFLTMLLPSVYYFVHRQSYIPKFLNKRRIKRRVLRKLNRNS